MELLIVLVVVGLPLVLISIIIWVEKLAGFALALLYLLFGLALLLGGVASITGGLSGPLAIIIAVMVGLIGAFFCWCGISLFLDITRSLRR